MTTKPFALTKSEIEEIASIKEIQEMWGAENAKDMQDYLTCTVYAVRFDFTSGSPGYCGDMFLLQGDCVQPPLTLIRDREKKFQILTFQHG